MAKAGSTAGPMSGRGEFGGAAGASTSSAAASLAYDPFLPEVQHDPYPFYARLRAHAPVLDSVFATRAAHPSDDIVSVLLAAEAEGGAFTATQMMWRTATTPVEIA